VSFLAKYIPTFVELAFIFRYVLRTGVQRPVGCSVCHIQEEWLPGRILFVQELHSVVGDFIRKVVAVGLGVEALVIFNKYHRILLATKGHRIIVEIVGTSAEYTIKLIEAALIRPGQTVFANVPFSGKQS